MYLITVKNEKIKETIVLLFKTKQTLLYMGVSLASLMSQQAGKTSSQLDTDPQWLFGDHWARNPHASRRETRF